MARYRLLEKAYLCETFLDPNPPEGPREIIIGDGTPYPFKGVPGPHMEPLDDEAKALRAAYDKAHPDATLDPVSKLLVTPVFSTDAERFAFEVEQEVERRLKDAEHKERLERAVQARLAERAATTPRAAQGARA